MREWRKIIDIKDNGYFGTTPFFIPFVDEPQKLSHAQYNYSMTLCCDYMGDSEAATEHIRKSIEGNNEIFWR